MGTPKTKIIATRAGSQTWGFTDGYLSTDALRNTIIYFAQHTEEWSDTAKIVLDNANNNLTNVEGGLRGYKFVISKGYETTIVHPNWAASTRYVLDDIVIPATGEYTSSSYICSQAGTSGGSQPAFTGAWNAEHTDNTAKWKLYGGSKDEYSKCPPMWVVGQRMVNSQGRLVCVLELIGTLNMMALDRANADFTQDTSNTDTIKTLLTAVIEATNAAFNHTTAYTDTWTSVDSLIDVYTPKDSYRIRHNESRLDVMKWLIQKTKCKLRVEDDEAIHIYNPTVSGVSYDYQYRFNVTNVHDFWEKSTRQRMVFPNYIVVESEPDTDGYSGYAEDTDSSDHAEVREYRYMRVASNEQATAIAVAILQHYQLDAEKGDVFVPMNVGQEIVDYIQIVDSTMGDTITANVMAIDSYSAPGKYEMSIHFGPKATKQFGGTTPPSLDLSIEVANMLSDFPGVDRPGETINKVVDYLENSIVPYLSWLNSKINEMDFTLDNASPTGNAGGDLTGTYPDPAIAAGAVTTAKLAALAVTTAKIADLAVTTGKLIDDAVTPDKLDTSNTPSPSNILYYTALGRMGWSSGAAPIGNAGGDLTGTYPNPTIAANAVTTAKINDAAVTTAKIADLAVTTGKLADGAVSIPKLYTTPGAVNSGDILKYLGDVDGKMEWDAGAPPTGNAGGDLTGTYPNPTVDVNKITYAKMQDISVTDRLLGRKTIGSGDPEEVSMGDLATMADNGSYNLPLYATTENWDEAYSRIVPLNPEHESLTISTGVVTVSKSFISVDTQGAAASDDLDTINGAITGMVLFIKSVSAARVVTVKHGTGNIALRSSQDCVLDGTYDTLTLIYYSNWWQEVTRSVSAPSPAIGVYNYYTGDGAQNRAIPHGLSRQPKSVRIWGGGVMTSMEILPTSGGALFYTNQNVGGWVDVTPMDATNFYIGDASDSEFAGNKNGVNYYWVAIG